MKKLIFGCTLMLVGVIGASAWLIAHAILIGPGAWKDIMTMIPLFGFRPSVDGAMVLVFYLISIVGTIIAVKELRKNN